MRKPLFRPVMAAPLPACPLAAQPQAAPKPLDAAQARADLRAHGLARA